MAVWEGKKYKLDKAENFEEYLKAIGVNFLIRKVASSVSPVVELVRAGDDYTLRSTSAVRTTTVTFKLDQECTDDGSHGGQTKNLFTMDGDKLTQRQTHGDGKVLTFLHEFTPDQYIYTTTYNGVTCVRKHKAI